MNWVRIFLIPIYNRVGVIPIYRINVFNFNFHCAITGRSPSGWVKDVAVAQSIPGNLWEWYSNGSQWVHFNFVIRVLPEINTHFVTTFPTPKGGVLITVSISINGISRLVSLCYELFTHPRTTYWELLWPYSCLQQLEMLYTSAVGVLRFILHLDGYFLSHISPKWSVQLWYW